MEKVLAGKEPSGELSSGVVECIHQPCIIYLVIAAQPRLSHANGKALPIKVACCPGTSSTSGFPAS